jgi:ATP-dependent Clp protease adaptor protein ClpS
MHVLLSTKPTVLREQQTTLLPRYRVLLHNDEVNGMEHVVKSLGRVFKFGRDKCEGIMLEAHRNGVALCVVEPLEQAELHRDQLRSHSLFSTIEPE